MSASTLLATLLAAAFAAFAASFPASDSDLFWHLQSGDWMLDHGALLERDVFSFTRAGSPYSVGQWLGQILLALAFRGLGWAGIDLLRAALVGIAVLFLARAVLRVQPHPGWAIAPILAAILVTRPFWGDRPQLFTLALFPVFLDTLLASRGDGRARRLAVLPVLVALWANLHGAFVLGLVLIAVFAIEAQLAPGPFIPPEGPVIPPEGPVILPEGPAGGVRALRRPLLLTLVASLGAGLLNPAFSGAYASAGAYASGPARFIVEERPPDLLTAFGLIFAALFGAALALSLARRDPLIPPEGPLIPPAGPSGGIKGRRPDLLWAGLIVPFTFLGLTVQRQLPYAAFVIAPYVALRSREIFGRLHVIPPEGPVIPPAGPSGGIKGPPPSPLVAPRPAAAAIVAALALAAVAAAALVAPREPDLAAYPVGSERLLSADSGRVLNEYDWGGYLIRFAPGVPTFIDGRARAGVLFVPDVLADFDDAVSLRPRYRAILERWDIRQVLLRPERPLAVALRESRWTVRGEAAGRWVLLERPLTPPEGPR